MSGGEFLRGVMSQGYIASRQKYYTLEIPIDNTVVTGSKRQAALQFKQEAYFLNTQVYVFCVRPGERAGFVVSNNRPLFLLNVVRSNGHKRSIAAQANIQYPSFVNDNSTNSEYTCYNPGEQIFVEYQVLSGATTQQLILLFEGIEYKYPQGFMVA